MVDSEGARPTDAPFEEWFRASQAVRVASTWPPTILRRELLSLLAASDQVLEEVRRQRRSDARLMKLRNLVGMMIFLADILTQQVAWIQKEQQKGVSSLDLIDQFFAIGQGREVFDRGHKALGAVLEVAWEEVRAIELGKATKERSGGRKHAPGTLDERALAEGKRLQQEKPHAWGVEEVAEKVKSTRQALMNKKSKNGPYKCPLFMEFWNEVQQRKAEWKHMRRGEV